jgi:hypothetical protein
MKVEHEFTELRLSEAQRAAFLERVRAAVGPEDYGLIQGMTQALPRLIELIEQTPSITKLRRLVFGPKTEKTRQLFPSAPSASSARSKSKGKGHGRTKARD